MSLNDKNLTGARGVDVHPGVANPTAASEHSNPLATNFVTDPTTDATGAGAASNFTGHLEAQRNFKQTAGVVEGRPGIIESTHIDPLSESSNKDDGWANARSTSSGTGSTGLSSTASGVVGSPASTASTAANVAAGAAKFAYGHAVGDEATKQAGQEAIWGNAERP